MGESVVGDSVVGDSVVGSLVGIRVGLDVGLRVVGLDDTVVPGLRVVGFAVPAANVGLLVGASVGALFPSSTLNVIFTPGPLILLIVIPVSLKTPPL